MKNHKYFNKIYAVADYATCLINNISLEQFSLGFCNGGGKIIQYRDKLNSESTISGNIEKLIPIVDKFNAFLIINDHIHLAQKYNLRVHIGQDQRVSNNSTIYGKSVHNFSELENVLNEIHPPEYIGFGAMFPSRTKPDVTVNRNILPDIINIWKKQIVLIGGITSNNIHQLPSQSNISYAINSDFFSFGPRAGNIEEYTKQILSNVYGH